MEPTQHLAALAEQGALLAGVPADALDAPVPAIEGWTIEAVVRHTGKVHRWVSGLLALPEGASSEDVGPVESLPTGPACLDAYRASLAELTEHLTAGPADTPAVSFVGPVDLAWWMRRQAHEVTVHRLDAERGVAAAGGPAPAPLPVDLAADGIDEWARVFLAVRYGQRFGALPDSLHGATVHLHGTDDPGPAEGAEWLLALSADGVAVTTEHAKGDVALRGPVGELLLALWRRRPVDGLEVFGERAVLDGLLDVARF